MTDKKEIKNLGKLTLKILEQIKDSDPNNTYGALLEKYEQSTEAEKLDLEQKYPSLLSSMNATLELNGKKVGKSDFFNFSEQFEKSERNRINRMNEQSEKFSIAMQEERERKEKLEQDRHAQLVSVLERNNSQQALADENAQLKAEIEKLQQEKNYLESEISKLKTGIEINSNSQLLLISTLFAKYRAEKPRVRTQDKTLKDIEEENSDISGLSFSQTSKIMAVANSFYKQLKNNK